MPHERWQLRHLPRRELPGLTWCQDFFQFFLHRCRNGHSFGLELLTFGLVFFPLPAHQFAHFWHERVPPLNGIAVKFAQAFELRGGNIGAGGKMQIIRLEPDELPEHQRGIVAAGTAANRLCLPPGFVGSHLVRAQHRLECLAKSLLKGLDEFRNLSLGLLRGRAGQNLLFERGAFTFLLFENRTQFVKLSRRAITQG